MARLALAGLCVIAYFACATSDNLNKGMDIATKAYDIVCWYETLKVFPKTQTKKFNQCANSAKSTRKSMDTNDFFKTYPDKKEEYFGKWLSQNAMGNIPATYKSACDGLLKEPSAAPSADESGTLNDGGGDYPYKAFSYCMMSQLRSNQGQKAIDAVKAEKTQSRKDWIDLIHTRENEFRTRHGVEPLGLEKELNSQAQQWADKLAAECNSKHSKNTDPGRQWNGGSTGESLSSGMGDDRDIAAYQAADGWYEEIQDYPFPVGYQDNDQNLFMKIGHFTQSVWKGSKKVGYGYAYNPECEKKKKFSRFVVARYSPPGNVRGKYPDNVSQPKD